MVNSKEVVRLAAVGDLHVTRGSHEMLHTLFTEMAESFDALLLCGDLTDHGLVEEAHLLARDLTSAVKVPIIGVLGNHDYEAGRQAEIKQILQDAGVTVLDGDTCQLHGVGFAGVKGFCGGFGRGALGPWGEQAIKAFVQEALDETLKLEAALARLRTTRRVALLHYAPIRATVEGEPLEIFPYLGSSRLEEPLNRFRVNLVFHGHAHRGSLEGRTSAGTHVYNVALPLLRRSLHDRPPIRVIELSMEPEPPTAEELSHRHHDTIAPG